MCLKFTYRCETASILEINESLKGLNALQFYHNFYLLLLMRVGGGGDVATMISVFGNLIRFVFWGESRFNFTIIFIYFVGGMWRRKFRIVLQFVLGDLHFNLSLLGGMWGRKLSFLIYVIKRFLANISARS